jgi:glutamate synthase (NADPH/NADH) small chain
MRKPTGFLEHPRELPQRRPVEVRLRDFSDVYERPQPGFEETQATRCMDCGIPFCHAGCPLGNLIPEWNGFLADGRLAEASERLHATNNFPEFTGALCPAPCEAACVLGINDAPVTIERIELDIAERAFDAGLVIPVPPSVATGRRVSVVGSGPAGLAAAQQLARAGHEVTVYERAERPGGLLRYGIPSFKLEKSVLDRRIALLEAEGVRFICSTQVGASTPGGFEPADLSFPRGPMPDQVTTLSVEELRSQSDAVLIATGSTVPRDLDVEGRSLANVVFALEFLRGQNLLEESRVESVPITAAGRDVIIIGGGDTGSDCLGTALRQGARSVTQLEILPRPPERRGDDAPWPLYPPLYRVSSSQEEGGGRRFASQTVRLLDRGDGTVRGIEIEEVEPAAGAFVPVPGTREELPADLVVLAMGFTGPERRSVVDGLGVLVGPSNTIQVDGAWATSIDGVFACGDAARGQSLVVWAIAEGRSAARAIDTWLTGTSSLPAPVRPSDRPIR